MPTFFSLPYVLGSLVVLGVAQACYYYIYLESPYDYYYRYCNVGCANMVTDDENFYQCCLPMTSGQTAPAVCASLSASCAAGGTTCTWGSAVPTTDQPSTSSAPATYVPPPYVPRDAAPTTETVWVTETTTTPCATPEPAPNSDVAAQPTSEAPEECVCEEEEEKPTAPLPPPPGKSAPPEGAAYDPSDASITLNDKGGEYKKKRRGIKIRNNCVCPSSTSAAVPAPTKPPPSPPSPTSDKAGVPTSEAPEECVCPTQAPQPPPAPPGNAPGEGNARDPTISNSPDVEYRRGLKARGGECVCPPPQPPCVCPSSAPPPPPLGHAPGEGNARDESISIGPDVGRRGLYERINHECVCPGESGVAGAPTSSMPPKPTGKPSHEGDARPDGDLTNYGNLGNDTEKRNIPPANYPSDNKLRRANVPGENHKRNNSPVQTVTSTTFVTTDDCAQSTAPPVPSPTSDKASVPITSAPLPPPPPPPPPPGDAPGEGSAAPDGYAATHTDLGRKREFKRWRDF